MALELVPVSAIVAYTGASTANATYFANAIENRIGHYCNRMTQGGFGNIWLSGSRTEYLDGELSSGVLLKWTPITAVSSVTQITGNGTSLTYTLTDLTVDGIEIADLATVNGRVGRLSLRSGIQYWDSEYLEARRSRSPFPNFGAGRQRIKVAYTGGYSAAPDDLKLAALNACKMLQDQKAVSATLKSESLGNYSYTNADPEQVKAMDEAFASVTDLIESYRSCANIV